MTLTFQTGRTQQHTPGNAASRRRRLTATFLLLPTIAALFVVTIYPTIYALWLSLHKPAAGSLSQLEFIGLRNYINLLHRQEFWTSLRVTLIFVTVSTLGTLILGSCLALLLKRSFFGRGIYMSLLILPTVATPVVSGLMWKYLLNPDTGVLNYFLSLVGITGPIWLAGSWSALCAIIMVEIWQWTPFITLLVLAGLQGIPEEQYDAARVDGANIVQTAIQVILPQLSAVLLMAALLRLIDSFKSFDTIFVMTAGGPGQATQVFNILAYYTGFRYFEFGRAAALTIVGLITLVVVAQILIGVSKVSTDPER